MPLTSLCEQRASHRDHLLNDLALPVTSFSPRRLITECEGRAPHRPALFGLGEMLP
jgi:hypothetical protein